MADALALACLALAGVYGWGFLPGAWLWAAYGASVAALVLWAAAGCGRRLLPALPDASEAERTALGAALGLGLLALGVFAVGSLGLLSASWWAPLLIGAAGFWGWREGKAALTGLSLPEDAALAAPSAVLLALAFWAAFVPPHQYDSLVYHLALPQAYLRQGGLAPVAGIIYSGFVQNGELLFTLALALGSELAPQLLSAAATALSAVLVWALARRLLEPRAAALALWLYCSHAAVLLLASTSYIEPWVGLWLLSGVHCGLRALEGEEGERPRLLLSGLFCGLACGAKYYAVLAPALLCGLLLWRRGRRGWGEAALLAAAAALVFAPWLLKNFWYLGNPVFPFLYKLFPGRGWSPSASAALLGDLKAGAPGYFKVLAEYGHPLGLLRELALFPYQLLLQATRFGGGMDVLGELGWPAVLLGAALAAWTWKRSRGRDLLLLYLAGHFLLWFATGVVLRFLVPVAGLFAVAAAGGYAGLWDRSGRAGRGALAAALAGLSLLSLFQAGYVHAALGSQEVLFGLRSPDAYLAARLAYYPCAKAAAGLPGSNAKILAVGEQRSFYAGAEVLPASVFQRNLYQELAASAKDEKALSAELRSRGFTHLLTVPAELERLKGYGLAEGLETPAWAALLKSAHLDYQGPACALLRLP